VRQSYLLKPDDIFRERPDVVFVGRRVYRAIQWETTERHRWAGRNWRRLKRERRKFISAPHLEILA
jgi:hypothetical protein